MEFGGPCSRKKSHILKGTEDQRKDKEIGEGGYVQ